MLVGSVSGLLLLPPGCRCPPYQGGLQGDYRGFLQRLSAGLEHHRFVEPTQIDSAPVKQIHGLSGILKS